MNDDATTGQRIDKWLWQARRFPTRTAAARFVEQSGLRVFRNGAGLRVDRPSYCVRPGDIVAFMNRGAPVAVRVVALGQRRGPPAEAAALYETCSV